jgi:DNA-binding NtrC family response regulator
MEDLPLVCQYLIEEINAAGSKQVGGFSQTALDRMHLFGWPGGIDQVRAVVAAAHRAAKGPEIAPVDLPPLLTHVEAAAAFPPETAPPIRLEELLAGIETSLIRRALEQSEGNKTRAATLLGMTRPRLYRRMEQLGMT